VKFSRYPLSTVNANHFDHFFLPEIAHTSYQRQRPYVRIITQKQNQRDDRHCQQTIPKQQQTDKHKEILLSATMPPKDYLRAREDAAISKDGSFCIMIDGAPYFPNLVVGVRQASSPPLVEERDNSIKKIIEHLIIILQTAADKGGESVTTATSSHLQLDSSSWTVTPVTGGNTNQLFCVSGIRCNENENNDSDFQFPNDSLLVRLFGADGMIDRDAETSTYASLANQQLALKYYGRFGNGRIEEMLVGWTTLTEDDLMGKQPALPLAPLPPVSLNERIARELARLHATFELPPHLLLVESEQQGSGDGCSLLPEPTLWTQLYPWLERSLKAEFRTDRDTERTHHGLDPPLSSLREELDWLKAEVIGNNENNDDNEENLSSAGIGFCHNDLLASNIMMLTRKAHAPSAASSSSEPSSTTESNTENRLLLEGLRFIDFEYGGINYYAYDIANHFNEYAGGTAVEDDSTPDYDRCPNDRQKKAFLEAYADEYNKAELSDGSSNPKTITTEELGARVDGFSLANHLVWGLWGVLQASSEGCEDGLDYLHYAKCRFDRYKHDKLEKYGTT
jgi:ethanolamine kinase